MASFLGVYVCDPQENSKPQLLRQQSTSDDIQPSQPNVMHYMNEESQVISYEKVVLLNLVSCVHAHMQTASFCRYR